MTPAELTGTRLRILAGALMKACWLCLPLPQTHKAGLRMKGNRQTWRQDLDAALPEASSYTATLEASCFISQERLLLLCPCTAVCVIIFVIYNGRIVSDTVATLSTPSSVLYLLYLAVVLVHLAEKKGREEG